MNKTKKSLILVSLVLLISLVVSGCGSKRKTFEKDKNGKLIGLEIPPEYDVRPAKDWKEE